METIVHQADWYAAVVFLAGILTRMTLVLMSCYCVARLLPRHAALRHAVLLAGLLSVLAMPFLGGPILALRLPRMSFHLPVEHPAVTPSDTVESSYEPYHVQESDHSPSGDTTNLWDTAVYGRTWAFWLTLVISVWTTGIVLRTVGLVRSFMQLRQLVKHASLADCHQLQFLIEEFRMRFRFEREIAILTSTKITNPLAVGVVRNCIVLPAGLTDRLSSSELKAVIFHEAAHLQRRDHIVLLLQEVLGTLLWWHPMALFVNRELTRAREEVCDNYVLQTTDAETYSEALLTISRFLYPPTETVGATPLWGSRWKLKNRVLSILDERRIVMTSLNLRTSAIVTTLCLGMSLVLATTGFSVAADEAENTKRRLLGVTSATEAREAEKEGRVPASATRANQTIHINDYSNTVDARLKRVELMLGALVRKLAINEKHRKEGRVPATRANQKEHRYDTSNTVDARLKRVERMVEDLSRHISFVEKKRQGSDN